MTKTDVSVDLFYSGAWHDITATADVLTRDPITITRGRPDEVSDTPPSTANLSIANADGTYSPRNPRSALYKLIGRNTPIRIGVGRSTALFDSFSRNVTDGWGVADTGHTYTLQGTAGDFDVTTTPHGHGTIQPSATASDRIAYVDSGWVDADLAADFTLAALPASGALRYGLVARKSDSSNQYVGRVAVTSSGAVTLELHKRVAGVQTTRTQATAITLTTGVRYTLRFEVYGIFLRVKFWLTTDPEPTSGSSVLEAVFTDLMSGTNIGAFVRNDTAATTHVVSVDDLTAAPQFRFYGEVESWPQRWNVKGSDVWTPITANGILRRLNAPGTSAPVASALRRAMLVGVLSAGLIAYWSLEEGTSATQAGSAVSGVAAMTFTAAVSPGSVLDPQAGSLPYAVMDNSDEAFQDIKLPSSTAGFFAFTSCVKGTMPRPSAAKAVMYQTVKVLFASGDITDVHILVYARWTGTAFDTSATGVDVFVTGGTPFGSVIGGTPVNMFDGKAHDIQVRLRQVGADVVGELWVDGVMADTATSAGKTLGAPLTVQAPVGAVGTLGGTAVDNSDTTLGFGHYAIHNDATIPKPHDAATGHPGERAAARLSRLCGEQGLVFRTFGDADLTERVGVQRIAPFLDLLQDAADADGGALFEPRTYLGLGYRTHESLYNQSTTVSLDYAAGDEVAPPLNPVEDTDATFNDVTVTRYLGASATSVQTTGTLNVNEPSDDPDGVGHIPKTFTLVLETDSQTQDQADWLRHIGTWDEARYPAVNMNLTAMTDAAVKAQAASLDVGARFAITNPPAWLPPDAIDQHAQGFTETLASHVWTIATNATPAGPYQVAIVSDPAADQDIPRVGSSTAVTGASLTTTYTGTLSVTTGADGLWTTAAGDFPMDVDVEGERVTLSTITGAASPQTFTISARSVNGVVKAHSSGVGIKPWRTAIIGR